MQGRGAQSQLHNPYQSLMRVQLPVIMDLPEERYVATEYQTVKAKSIVNEVNSPDLNFKFSLNPYQGCEHGCSYCYARPTHNYWGHNAGVEFESKIMVKENAVELLENKLRSKSWTGETIMFSGNTDCYQPIEKKLGLTRSLLKTCLSHRQSVGIITKNDLLLRDLDILEALNAHGLVQVAISITTLNETLRREMEPRTSTAYNRLRMIKKLSEKNIPVTVMMAPVIPGLNDHEMMQIAANSSKLGAKNFYYTMVRLNDEVEAVFVEWLTKAFPKRKDKVLNLIRSCRDGALGDKRFHVRMRGTGSYAAMIQEQYKLVRKKYYNDHHRLHALNKTLYMKQKNRQLCLFE